ncbi:MAG TPA: DUF934 domain-containing protein [Allosphingosinicella sp.]|nr:DUF934 domain-containing protein [Allosphingosinicella sp.]
MSLLKDGQLVADRWHALGDADPVPPDHPVLVSLARWQAERETLLLRNAPLGVRLPNNQPVTLLAADLERLELIALEFPKFSDGRAYSQARLLRERHGFRGELRATGNVLRDQLFFMQRCGFDAFELAKPDPVGAWRAATGEFDIVYQPATDTRVPAARRRQRSVAGGAAAGTR